MNAVTILGAGAFGTALAMALARPGRPVTLWGRAPAAMADIAKTRENARHLPGRRLPAEVTATAEPAAMAGARTVLLTVPTQTLAGVLAAHAPALAGKTLVACCKGIDLASGLGPAGLIARALPGARAALLTGPGFAADIGAGLPTALTLACADDALGAALQQALAGPVIRLYRTTDVAGAELGGALKNVIAIAAGLAIGAGLGDSARAAVLTRGFAEMVRLATARGARAGTLAGLSGLGDLVLTCTSDKSRNFAHGLALGRGTAPAAGVTVEGVATATATVALARESGVEVPLAETVARVCAGATPLDEAIARLMSRPLKEE